jgi:hypothetical protein
MSEVDPARLDVDAGLSYPAAFPRNFILLTRASRGVMSDLLLSSLNSESV